MVGAKRVMAVEEFVAASSKGLTCETSDTSVVRLYACDFGPTIVSHQTNWVAHSLTFKASTIVE